MKKSFKFLLFVFMGIFLSCNQSNQEPKRILRTCLDIDPTSLDPRVAGAIQPQVVIGMLYEGLMRLDRNGKPAPGIAERYEMAEDYLSCTFYLRRSEWSNGQPLTAYDFMNAWREALKPDFDSNHSFAFYILKNAKAAKEGKISIEQIGVTAIDDLTLFVEFEHPSPFFVDLTANPLYSPVFRKNFSDELVSNGPFILKNWKQNESLLVVKNEKYWDAKSIHIDGISVAMINDPNTSWMMYEQGMLDVVGAPMTIIPIEALFEIQKDKSLHTGPTSGLCWVLFNTEQPPFHSAKIRKAFSYAIDRNEITEKLLQGGETASTSILPLHLALQEEPYFKDSNIEEARRLFKEGLEELGMTKENMPKIQFNFVTRINGKVIAQVIQQQWRKAFEIPIELVMKERSVYSPENSEFQVSLAYWNSWLNDPAYNLGHLKTKNRLNVSRWENQRYRELVESAERETNIKKRQEFFHEAEKIAMDEMPIAPLFFSNDKYTKKATIEGIQFANTGHIDFKWVEMKESSPTGAIR